jgi:hypothetical protein
MTISPEVGYSGLHLPRILCLHGGGTNARIFHMQCRVLERFLCSDFRLVYARAPFPAQPGPDVTSVYKNHGPFSAWLPSTPEDREYTADEIVDKVNAALEIAMYTDDLCGATGEWVALIGFSQGAKIAASILYSQQVLPRRLGNTTLCPDFRFALLLAGRGPLVWLMPGSRKTTPQGLVDAAQSATLASEPVLPIDSDEHVLKVPTIHVHGLRDPGLKLHRRLLNEYCHSDTVTLIEWNGDHRVPIKTKDVSAVAEQIYLLARESGILSLWS